MDIEWITTERVVAIWTNDCHCVVLGDTEDKVALIVYDPEKDEVRVNGVPQPYDSAADATYEMLGILSKAELSPSSPVVSRPSPRGTGQRERRTGRAQPSPAEIAPGLTEEEQP
jgi:hypothetical protein